MKQKFLMILFTLAATGYVVAEPTGGEYSILRQTIDAGGGRSSGGDFIITGTIGQHDASLLELSGGEYALSGGFWARTTTVFSDFIFADGFEG